MTCWFIRDISYPAVYICETQPEALPRVGLTDIDQGVRNIPYEPASHIGFFLFYTDNISYQNRKNGI